MGFHIDIYEERNRWRFKKCVEHACGYFRLPFKKITPTEAKEISSDLTDTVSKRSSATVVSENYNGGKSSNAGRTKRVFAVVDAYEIKHSSEDFVCVLVYENDVLVSPDYSVYTFPKDDKGGVPSRRDFPIRRIATIPSHIPRMEFGYVLSTLHEFIGFPLHKTTDHLDEGEKINMSFFLASFGVASAEKIAQTRVTKKTISKLNGKPSFGNICPDDDLLLMLSARESARANRNRLLQAMFSKSVFHRITDKDGATLSDVADLATCGVISELPEPDADAEGIGQGLSYREWQHLDEVFGKLNTMWHTSYPFFRELRESLGNITDDVPDIGKACHEITHEAGLDLVIESYMDGIPLEDVLA